MRVRCLQCQHPIELKEDASFHRVCCPSCGVRFSLVGAQATTTEPTLIEDSPSQGPTIGFDKTTGVSRAQRTEGNGWSRPSLESTQDGRERAGGAKVARPKAVGRFLMLKQLGSGGFGTVWMAHDPQLDRIVAVKIPHPGQFDHDDAEVFFREARAAAQLNHPNIVAVHEVGRADELLFIVSDFVRGTTLEEWLKERRPTLREAAVLCAKIADGLDHAHKAGVIHRDLKPANIMIDLAGEPHIMDFGLSRREAGEASMTIDGRIIGTPAYMSPEQAGGRGHSADRRSDVYGLGVILFRLLTGDLPFRGNVIMLIAQILEDEPPSLRKLNHHIPRDLETICLKCLQKRPDRRYQNAADLAADLRRWLAGEPIQARPVGRLERAWRWCRREPLLAGVSALAIALFFTTFAAITVGYARAREQLRETLWHAARADRQLLDVGHRQKATGALEQAAGIRPGPELRDEYLRALELPDLELVRQTSVAEDDDRPCLLALPCRNPRRAIVLTGAGRLVEYDAFTGQLRTAHQALGTFRDPVALSADGRLFAARVDDGSRAEVWDLAAEKKLGTLRDREGRDLVPSCLAFSPRGDRLVATVHPQSDLQKDTGWLFAIDRTALRAVDSFELPYQGQTNAVWFHPSGSLLAISFRTFSDSFHRVLLWSVSQWKLVAALPLEEKRSGPVVYHQSPGRIDFSPDGRRMVAGGSAGTIKLWTLVCDESGANLKAMESISIITRAPNIWVTRFSPNGRWLLTLGGDNQAGERLLELWDAEDGQKVVATALPGAKGFEDGSAEWSESGSHILAHVGRNLRLWTFQAPNAHRFTFSPATAEPESIPKVDLLVFSPRETWLACGVTSPPASAWHLIELAGTPRRVWSQEGHGGQVDLAFSADETTITTSCEQIKVREARSGTVIEMRPTIDGSFLAWGTDASGHSLVAGVPNNPEPEDRPRLKVWDLDAKTERLSVGLKLAEVPNSDEAVGKRPAYPRFQHVRLSPDGSRLGWLEVVPPSQDGQLRLFDLRTGQPYWGRLLSAPTTLALADEARLVAVSQGPRVTVWAPDRSEQVATFQEHENDVIGLALDRSGQRLAAIAAGDETIVLWDTARRQWLASFRTGSHALVRVALSPSGRWLAAGDTQGHLWLWDLAALRARLDAAGLAWPDGR